MAMVPKAVPCIKITESGIPIAVSVLQTYPAYSIMNQSFSTEGNYLEIMGNLNLSIEEVLLLNESRIIEKMEPDSIISSPVYLSISIASAIGNLIMLSVILCNQRFRKPANLLIANLSLASFLFIFSSNLRLLENSVELWPYTNSVCQILAILHRVPVPVVALTTMIISLDRGRIARNPMTGSTTLSPMWRIIFIWSFSLIIVFPLGFTRKFDQCIPFPYKCTKVVMFNHSALAIMYGVSYLMSVHIIPAVILIRESVKTFNKIKFLQTSGTIQSQMVPTLPDNRLRLLRNSCIFCLIFLVFWLPYGIFQFPLDLPPEILPDILIQYLNFYFKFIRNITYVQIALNPVILFILSCDLCKYVPRLDWPI